MPLRAQARSVRLRVPGVGNAAGLLLGQRAFPERVFLGFMPADLHRVGQRDARVVKHVHDVYCAGVGMNCCGCWPGSMMALAEVTRSAWSASLFR